jgi:hypothetical protein
MCGEREERRWGRERTKNSWYMQSCNSAGKKTLTILSPNLTRIISPVSLQKLTSMLIYISTYDTTDSKEWLHRKSIIRYSFCFSNKYKSYRPIARNALALPEKTRRKGKKRFILPFDQCMPEL